MSNNNVSRIFASFFIAMAVSASISAMFLGVPRHVKCSSAASRRALCASCSLKIVL